MTATNGSISTAYAESKLSAKQLRYARLVPSSESNTKAAIEAGYSGKSAGREASRLLKNPYVMAVIADERKKLAARSAVKADDVVRRLGEQAMTDVTDFVVSDPNSLGGWRFRRPDELSAAQKALVKGFTTKTFERTVEHPDGTVEKGPVTIFEYTFHDGQKALDLLMSKFGLKRDVKEIHGSVNARVEQLFTFISDSQHRQISSTVGIVEAKAIEGTVVAGGDSLPASPDTLLTDGTLRPREQ